MGTSDKADAQRYRKLLGLQTQRAAKLIEASGTVALDQALDAIKMDANMRKNFVSLRAWLKTAEPKKSTHPESQPTIQRIETLKGN